jgi:hypothetical protein
MVASLPGVQDSDDLYYSAEHKRIYMPGGEGLIYVFQQNDPDHYSLLSKVPLFWVDGRVTLAGKEKDSTVSI